MTKHRHPVEPNEWAWADRAACLGQPVELFFYNGPKKNNRATINKAKSICAGCPVKNDCLEHALQRPEWTGVWGGYTEGERNRLRRKRARLKPI